MDGTTMPCEFLAYLLTTALFTAILLPLLRPVVQRWLRIFWSSRLRAALSLALLLAFVYIGGSLDKQNSDGPETSLRTGGGSALPLFYYDLGYPTVDTDGDGIPDYWERRTHTNRLVPDSAADYDHDGVDNAEEFLHQCDPLTKDTDGDGLTDREEIDGAIAGMAGFDPLVQCDYPEDTSDAEAWGTNWHPVRFVGVNDDGFPLNVGYPDEADDNVDVLLTVDTTRYAELTWEDGFGPKDLLLPPCTNLPLRLRVPASESSSVSLSAATGATGLWKAALRAEWDTRRGLPIERDRVHSGSGWLVDTKTSPAVFSGILPGTFDATNEPMRSGVPHRQNSDQNAPQLSITMYARRAFHLELSATCRIHGPNPTFWGSFTNAVPPFLWTVNGQEYTTSDPVLNLPFTADEYHVGCFDSGRYTMLPLGTNAIFHLGQCQNGPATNVVGAGWTSTHNPTNATDHLPFVEEVVEQFAPLCPVNTNTVVHAGWTHNALILWIRNLVRKMTGNLDDDDTDHCISVLWAEDGTIDLWSFLDSSCLPYTNALSIRVWKDGGIDGPALGTIPMGECPSEMLPTVHNVVLCDKGGMEVFDRFWLVICTPQDQTDFDNWYNLFCTNLEWTAWIPLPPSHLDISTNTAGTAEATIPTYFSGHSSWSSPRPISASTHMHHTAKYELRTETIDQSGNQATYDAEGRLITKTIAAGTADYYQPYDVFGNLRPNGKHRRFDVLPYVRALQLDGNPGHPFSVFVPTNITHPCLRQGTNLDQYLFCRPCVY